MAYLQCSIKQISSCGSGISTKQNLRCVLAPQWNALVLGKLKHQLWKGRRNGDLHHSQMFAGCNLDLDAPSKHRCYFFYSSKQVLVLICVAQFSFCNGCCILIEE